MTQKSHSKLLTVIISMVLPGSGHFYLGYPGKAIILLGSLLILNYVLMYISTIYVTPLFIIISLLIFLALYLYIIYDVLQIIKHKKTIYKKYSHWIFTIFLYIPLMYLFILLIKNIMPIRTFSMPAISMEDTVLKNDYLVAVRKDSLKRGQLSIFRYPNNPSIFYLKRCVAIENDEIIYMDKQLLIHFHEGDQYILNHYESNQITTIDNKLWVINPYIHQYPTIKYDTNETTSFEYLTTMHNYKREIGMTFKKNIHNKSHFFYTKVSPQHFFMMGDNREHSNDSRFWGSVNKNLLFGEPNMIYFHLDKNWIINWDRIGIKLNTNIDKNSI